MLITREYFLTAYEYHAAKIETFIFWIKGAFNNLKGNVVKYRCSLGLLMFF